MRVVVACAYGALACGVDRACALCPWVCGGWLHVIERGVRPLVLVVAADEQANLNDIVTSALNGKQSYAAVAHLCTTQTGAPAGPSSSSEFAEH
eukprot:5404672-Prymnesium_polylepis.1